MNAPSERREAIRDCLARQGRVSVRDLSHRMGVASMTIRRDLASMEAEGFLTRTHGGCVPRGLYAHEMAFAEKSLLHAHLKLATAREVARRIEPDDAVYLDTGTTAVEVARALPREGMPRVFTNNLSVAMELFGRSGARVVVYGGALAGRSPDLVGEIALAHVDDFRLDVAIIGADAVDAERGEFYGADAATAMLSQRVQRQAARTWVVADSSKFGKKSLARAGKLGPGCILFSDDGLAGPDRAAVRRSGAELVCAKTTPTSAGSEPFVRNNRSKRPPRAPAGDHA